jgi:hypothetical protein
LAQGRPQIVEGISERFSDVPRGKWHEPVQRVLTLPFSQPGERKPFGFLLVGLNPYRLLDADYRGFIELIAARLPQRSPGLARSRRSGAGRRISPNSTRPRRRSSPTSATSSVPR